MHEASDRDRPGRPAPSGAAPARAKRWLPTLAGVLLAIAAPMPAEDGQTDAAKADRPRIAPELRKVAEGYLANRGAFKSFRCEFTYRVGAAADLVDALKRGPTVGPLTATCKWAVDGARFCYSREIDKAAKAAMARAKANPQPHAVGGKPGFVAAIPLSALGYLTDGKRALRCDPDFAANLMGPGRIAQLIEGLSPSITPWALGGLGRTMGSNPGRWILDGKLGTWRLLDRKQADGRDRIVVECRRETARLVYTFDAKRGFLPVRREYELKDGRKTHVAVTDVRECPRGRWFPGRTVFVNVRAGGTVRRVQEIAVTALDADHKPSPDEMSLVVRGGVKVLHVDNLLSAFRLPAEERVGVDGLEALHARCNEVLERRLRRRAEAAGGAAR